MTKCHGLPTKSPMDILNARIADRYACSTKLPGGFAFRDIEISIPLWVAEELKQALEKQ